MHSLRCRLDVGSNFTKVGVIIIFMKTKFFIVLTLIVLIFSTASADLVWDKKRGWQIQGGVLSNIFGDTEKINNALQAMNSGKEAEDNGEYATAIKFYNAIVSEYPESMFAPEAYFQMGKCYAERGMFDEAFESYQKVILNYPDYTKFNLVLGAEYNLASAMQDGATVYLWGWMPWFTSANDIIKIYEAVIKNAPYGDYAPLALMNIALVSEKDGQTEVAIDALDRLINTYPNSLLTSDAYIQMGRTYNNMVAGPEYDQESVVRAMNFYQDFTILFPTNTDVSKAEKGFKKMQDIHARSRLVMGDFYYYYRTDNKAASIFYNETITIAPSSDAANEAREQLKKIADGEIAPMTPVDWFFGRYEKPSYDRFEEEAAQENLQVEKQDYPTALPESIINKDENFANRLDKEESAIDKASKGEAKTNPKMDDEGFVPAKK